MKRRARTTRRYLELGAALQMMLAERKRAAAAATLGERLAGLPVVRISARDVAARAGLKPLFVMQFGRRNRDRALTFYVGADEYVGRYRRGAWHFRPAPALELTA